MLNKAPPVIGFRENVVPIILGNSADFEIISLPRKKHIFRGKQ